MTTSMLLDAGFIIILIVFALAGLRRGPWPEVVALGGILLGALLADEWGDVWGARPGRQRGGARRAGRADGGARRAVPAAADRGGLWRGGAAATAGAARARARGWRARGSGCSMARRSSRCCCATGTTARACATGPLMTDPVGRALLEWAGWWPLLLALGGILAGDRRGGAARRPRDPARAGLAARRPRLASCPTTTPAPAPRAFRRRPTRPSSPHARPAPRRPRRSRRGPRAMAAPGPAGHPPRRSHQAGAGRRGAACRTCGNVLAPGRGFLPQLRHPGLAGRGRLER